MRRNQPRRSAGRSRDRQGAAARMPSGGGTLPGQPPPSGLPGGPRTAGSAGTTAARSRAVGPLRPIATSRFTDEPDNVGNAQACKVHGAIPENRFQEIPRQARVALPSRRADPPHTTQIIVERSDHSICCQTLDSHDLLPSGDDTEGSVVIMRSPRQITPARRQETAARGPAATVLTGCCT